MDDKEKIALLDEMQSEEQKLKLIKSIEDEDLRISLIDKLKDDADKADVIISFKDDDRRISLLDKLGDDAAKFSIIMNLIDDKKKILSIDKLKDKFYKAWVIANIKDKVNVITNLTEDEKKISLLYILKDDYDKVMVIASIKDDEKKKSLFSELFDEIQSEEQKLELIKSIKDEELRISLLYSLKDDYKKAEVIESLTDYEKKKSLFSELLDKIRSNDALRLWIILSVEDEDLRISLIDKLEDKFNKARVISSIKDKVNVITNLTEDEKKISLLYSLKDDYDKVRVIASIKDDEKKKSLFSELLDEIQSEKQKLKLIKSIEDEDIRILLIDKLENEYYKASVIGDLKDDERKISLIDKLEDDNPRFQIILSVKDDEKKISLLDKIRSNDNLRLRIILSVKDDKKKISLLDKLGNDSEKVMVIASIKDETLMMLSLDKLEDDWNKIYIMSFSSDIEIRKKGIIFLNFFDNFDNREDIINKLVETYKVLENRGNSKIRDNFKFCIDRFQSSITEKNIEVLPDILNRLDNSNSLELSRFCTEFCNFIINSENWEESFEKIENIFLKNNLPMFGKVFLCFQYLYPNFEKDYYFDFSSNSRLSPELLNPVQNRDMEVVSRLTFGNKLEPKDIRFQIVFNDLMRIASKSNNRSLIEYLSNIEIGNTLFMGIQKGSIEIKDLDDESRKILEVFSSHLQALYEKTFNSKNLNQEFDKLSLEEKIVYFAQKFQPNQKYDLPDRIVRSFAYQAGIKNFQQLKDMVINSIFEKDRLNRTKANILRGNSRFELKKGDFIRGIGNIDSFGSSLDNGNVCKEFLGTFNGTSDSDTTPLDIDFTLITQDGLSIYENVENSPTGFGFGNIYIILDKGNPNINITRDENGNLINSKYESDKIEMFGTNILGDKASNHWGARTGIASTDIDYILYKSNRYINSTEPYDSNGNVNYVDKENVDDIHDLALLKMEIVKNGFYIPVIDFSGKLIFTPEEYDELKLKMEGLSHYAVKMQWNSEDKTFETYHMKPHSENIMTQKIKELLPNNQKSTQIQSSIINSYLRNLIEENIKTSDGLPMKYKDKIGDDITSGSIEVVSTGSTARETNIPGDYDFDYIFRIDAEIFNDSAKMETIQGQILSSFGIPESEHYKYKLNSNIREAPANIPNLGVVPIDITFVKKTNKVEYSTDMALEDRMKTISMDYELDKEVKSNIILAKMLLKAANCYKPNRRDREQGGLGGVGIENWVLQNGGSLESAAESFLVAASLAKQNFPNDEDKEYLDFMRRYQIFDFGANHLAENRDSYLYDEFVYNNMNKNGYKKMCIILGDYLKYIKGKDKVFEDSTLGDFVKNVSGDKEASENQIFQNVWNKILGLQLQIDINSNQISQDNFETLGAQIHGSNTFHSRGNIYFLSLIIISLLVTILCIIIYLIN